MPFEKRFVTLDADKCKGCITCMKRCPTEAIRVRGGKAKILYERCIACGECIRACSYHAKKAVYDKMEIIDGYKYKVALPPPALYGQFNNLNDINYVLEGLLSIGFDDIYETSRGAELISEATRNFIADGKANRKPIIGTTCPAIVDLILLKFHDLKDNMLTLLTPVDVAAKLAREKAVADTGLRPEEIGVFFISSCPAKVYSLKSAFGVKAPLVDGVLSVNEIYFKLINEMPKIQNPRELSKAGVTGLSWAVSGGEAAGIFGNVSFAVDGLENVINILKDIEDDKVHHTDYIELNACSGGCVGGVLNIENPYIAKAKIGVLKKYAPVSKNNIEQTGKSREFFCQEKDFEVSQAFKLDDDRVKAMTKLKQIGGIYRQLAHLDCGICGAPSCKAFSEDVVLRGQSIEACVKFRLPELGGGKER
ncbi:MAG: 4Fe-4S dicluster domain-containing protein [Clostridiales bacterium]|jgi:iron only hydrogenase large subunit-like protein|nr:4Fe-4S dicluster domain-containing protein [Clostridiales bacterium]